MQFAHAINLNLKEFPGDIFFVFWSMLFLHIYGDNMWWKDGLSMQEKTYCLTIGAPSNQSWDDEIVFRHLESSQLV